MIPRIAIVGGGIGGLSLAHFLRRAGHRRVTVFEREPRPGGKCRSVPLQGRAFDLGATIIPPGFRAVRGLLREYGVPIERLASRGPCGLYDTGTRQRRKFSARERLRLTWALARFFLGRRRAGDFSRPGFGHLDVGLAEPFAAWLRRHELEELAAIFAPFLTGYGYGYLEEIPAAYALAYLAPAWTVPSLFGGTNRTVSAGYQALVERMAIGFDVRLGVAVRALEPGARLTVVTDRGAESFDHAIFAAGRAPEGFFARVDPEVEELFREVRTYSFHAAVAEVTGLPASTVFLPAHFERGRGEGRLGCGHQQWPRHSAVTLLMSLARAGADAETVEAATRADLAKLGGIVGATLARQRWDYFPHAPAAAFARGFYRRLERAQGRHGVWFAGELMSFPTVEHVVRYSRHVVAEHF